MERSLRRRRPEEITAPTKDGLAARPTWGSAVGADLVAEAEGRTQRLEPLEESLDQERSVHVSLRSASQGLERDGGARRVVH
jgi:hypothetical protein